MEEYFKIWSLQNGRSVVLKPVERQLSDEKTYEEVRITEKDQIELVEDSNNLSSNLGRKNVITENENNYFRINFKNYKGLCNVPEWLVISNCLTPSEKVSEFLDHYLQSNKTRRVLYERCAEMFWQNLRLQGKSPKELF